MDHLFFHCRVLIAIRNVVSQRMGLHLTSKSMKELHKWFLHSKSLTGAQRKTVEAALAAVYYTVCRLGTQFIFRGK